MEDKEKWIEIGKLSKSIRNDLFKLSNLSKEIKMRKKEIHSINRSLKYLDKYRSDSENLMISRGIKDFNIFYGDNDA